MLEVSPDSVIEVDCHIDGEKRYFDRFLCTWAMYAGF
jgi:hypothetical protein